MNDNNQHWWCVTADGTIVDPTADQFRRASLVYEEHDDEKHGPLPTGKCPNCGDYCYTGEYCCSKECDREYVDYVNQEARRW